MVLTLTRDLARHSNNHDQMASASFYKLIAWQKAMDLAERIYRTTGTFPREERFGLTAQLRKCAVSVPSNIAEGHGRLTVGEWRHFLGQARGSVLEMQTQLILSNRLGFADAPALEADLGLSEEVGRIINGLLRSLPDSTKVVKEPR
jgi:four helix bundle protein